MVGEGLRRECFRTPTPAEVAEFQAGLAAHRLQSKKCPGDCKIRSTTGAVWTCNICRAVWTESSNGYCLGRALTPDEMESEVDRLVREIFSERPFPRGCGIDETEFQAEVEIYAKAFITTYRELLASKASSSPVLGVHQENYDRVHFLMIDED